MKSLRLALVPFVGFFLFAGCSSGSTGSDGTVNDAAAKQVATQVASAAAKARTGSDGPGAAFALAAAGQAAQGIVTANGGAYTAQARSGEKIGAAPQADVGGSVDCTATGCTFTGFAMGAGAAGVTIDGTLSWANDKLTCDLNVGVTTAGTSVTVHEVCNLTITATSIDGTLETTGSVSVSTGISGLGSGAQASWDASITFNDVEVNAAACTTSGSVDVDGTATASGISASASGSVTFDGSGC